VARERVHVNIWEIFSCRYGVFIDVICGCVENDVMTLYMWHTGRINQWRKLVGERERSVLCGSHYTDKKNVL
jgi:hypothetical protein